MSEGAFKVFVSLHMVDFASRHLSHFSNLAGQAGKGIDSVNKKLALMGGIAATMVGGAAVGAMTSLVKHSVEAATELDTVERKLRAIGGVNLKSFANISKQGWALGNDNPWTSQVDRLHIFGDLHTVFGDTKTAQKLWNPAMQFKTAMMQVDPNTAENQFFAAFKAAELSTAGKNGHIVRPEDFMHRLDMFAKIYAGTMGRVKPTDMYAFMKQAKYSRFSLTDDAIYKAGALMYEQGGSVTGTAYQALARVAAGRLGNASSGATYAAEWERMGLLRNITERSKQGNPKKFDIAGRDLLYTDPNKWAESVFLPAMNAKGFNFNNKENFTAQLTRMFGNQTAGNAVFTMLQQRGILAKDASVFKSSKGINALNADSKDAYALGFKALAESLKDLNAVIGKALKPVIVPALHALANGIRQLTSFAKDHPGLTRLVVIFTMLAGVALMAGGALLTLGTLLVTAFTVTIPTLGAAGIAWIIAGVLGLIALIATAIANPGGIMGAVNNLLKAIVGGFKIAAGMVMSIAGGLSLQKGLTEAGLKLGKEGMKDMGLGGKPTATPSGKTISQAHVSIHVSESKNPKDTANYIAEAVRQAVNPTQGFLNTKTHLVKHGYA